MTAISRFLLGACLLTCALIFGSLATPWLSKAEAKVRISERTKYYSVSGRNGKQLFKSIIRRGPKLKSTGHAIATTRTKIDIKNVKVAIKGRRCVVKADVRVSLLYTFPKWRGNKRASKKLKGNWDKFFHQVKRHEATHGRISREYARQLHKKINRLTGRVSKGCSDFGRRSKRSIRLIQKSFLNRHRNFDRREGRSSARIRRLQRALLISR
ncbi:MAG: DUF922 domain-containing protein [Rhizobiaceae bacterium]